MSPSLSTLPSSIPSQISLVQTYCGGIDFSSFFFKKGNNNTNVTSASFMQPLPNL